MLKQELLMFKLVETTDGEFRLQEEGSTDSLIIIKIGDKLDDMLDNGSKRQLVRTMIESGAKEMGSVLEEQGVKTLSSDAKLSSQELH